MENWSLMEEIYSRVALFPKSAVAGKYLLYYVTQLEALFSTGRCPITFSSCDA